MCQVTPLVNTFDACVKHWLNIFKIESYAFLLCSTVYTIEQKLFGFNKLQLCDYPSYNLYIPFLLYTLKYFKHFILEHCSYTVKL